MATRRPKVPKASSPSSKAASSNTADETRNERSTSSVSGPAGKSPQAGKATPTSKAMEKNGGRKIVPEAAPVPARSFSGRLVALVVVLIAIAVILTPSVNTFMQQRADMAALRADIAAKEKQQQDLQNQLSRWSDPAYIQQQARDRLNMIQPGETGYWVYGGNQTPATPDQPGTSVNPEGLPWVDGLWTSIVRSATE